jgi:UDP-N-acetylmuramate--alanine ligase
MSALARYYSSKGNHIHGYDKTPTPLTAELQKEGMVIHFEDRPDAIPAETGLVIYTPAIPPDLREFHHLRESGIPMIKRSEAIGRITAGRTTIAIAGTHGKTSISALTAHILMRAGAPVTALIGGISKNYGTNHISSGKEDIMVVEADEFDRSFLHIHPDIAVISSMDADHLDIYGNSEELHKSFSDFAANIKSGGKAIVRDGLDIRLNPDTRRVDYAAGERSEVFAHNLRIEDGHQLFDLMGCMERANDISLLIPGRHNVENAVAAIAACRAAGIGLPQILAGLKTFTGVRRRFDFRVNRPDCVFIDDYAHHPRELEAFIIAVRELFPGKKITGLFQPHLYSRTRDFAEGFARSLDLLDVAWLLDIYPARELPIPGIDSGMIHDLMSVREKAVLTREEVMQRLNSQKPEVFLTIGAGDIDQMVEPIEKLLSA